MYTKLIADRIQVVQEHLDNFGFPSFFIKCEITKLQRGVSGIALITQDKIQISIDYLKEFQDQVITRTVAHEVCHLYVSKYFPRSKQHHGPEFRRLMNLLKVDNSTKHSMQLSTQDTTRRKRTRYEYVADNGNVVKLTPQQHKKQCLYDCYRANGMKIRFTGRKLSI